MPRALEDLGQQPGREGELVALAGQGERLQLAQRQQAGQVVAAVERAQPVRSGGGAGCRWPWPRSATSVALNLCRRWPAPGGIRFDEVGGLEAACRPGGW